MSVDASAGREGPQASTLSMVASEARSVINNPSDTREGWFKTNLSLLGFVVALAALLVSFGSLLLTYLATFPTSDVSIHIIGANKSFLEKYITDEQSVTILLNAEIRNTGANTKLVSAKPTMTVDLYRYDVDSTDGLTLNQVAHLEIPFVPKERDFLVYQVTAQDDIQSGNELDARTESKVAFMNTLLNEDPCRQCVQRKFPEVKGYNHVIIVINDHHTLGLSDNSRAHEWLASKLKQEARVIVGDAMFLARLAPENVDPIEFYGKVFWRPEGFFKADDKDDLVSIDKKDLLFIDFVVELEVETEDGQTIRAKERFFSVGHLRHGQPVKHGRSSLASLNTRRLRIRQPRSVGLLG